MRKNVLIGLTLIGLSVLSVDVEAQFYVVKDGEIVYGLDEGTADYITFNRSAVATLLLEDAPEYVDLGLSSKTLWAATNVGAERPENFGSYYSWGEIATHYNEIDTDGKPIWGNDNDGYNWTAYKHSDKSGKLSKYVPKEKSRIYGVKGKSDDKVCIDADDDVATVSYGKEWHIPTRDDFQELYEQCEWKWTDNYEETGVAGYIIESKDPDNDNSIFLPASGYIRDTDIQDVNNYGYYWTQNMSEDRYDFATYLFFYDGYIGPWHNGYKYTGHVIRPVRKITSIKE